LYGKEINIKGGISKGNVITYIFFILIFLEEKFLKVKNVVIHPDASRIKPTKVYGLTKNGKRKSQLSEKKTMPINISFLMRVPPQI